MEMIIRNKCPEHNMEHKSSAIVSERYKKVSGTMTKRRERNVQDGTGRQQETSYATVSSDGDTLSVSKAGKAANSQKAVMDGVVIKKEVAENRHVSETSIANLSVYSETELKQMYLDGDITRAEYNEEISGREIQAEVNG